MSVGETTKIAIGGVRPEFFLFSTFTSYYTSGETPDWKYEVYDENIIHSTGKRRCDLYAPTSITEIPDDKDGRSRQRI